jgi:DNA-binding beta-propeller fold protein YncE
MEFFMTTRCSALQATAILTTLVVTAACGTTNAQSSLDPSNPWLRPVAVISLPNVSGRIDHLAFDAGRQHLFVAALGNDTVEVIDTGKNVHLRSLPGFHEPQGIAVVPDPPAVAIANGDTGTLQLLDGNTLQTRWTTKVGGDADNVRYDAPAKQLYVAAEGGLFDVDPASGKVAAHIEIAGHPESFQLERDGARVFANLPGASQVVVGDRQRVSVLSRWNTGSCQANYPMALDETTHRVFVGCRRPAAVTVFDTTNGKTVSSTPTVGDTDDLFYDTARKRVYVIGGEGFVDVFTRDGETLRRVFRAPTRDGARTGLWVQDQNRLYVAVPARRGQPAEIRVFQAAN